MEKPKILSGQVIVAKGITKIDVTLPEVGLKDIIPNGSWLEQKQVQAALEARKHLIEVERIEKHGTLSHAIWRDDLQLAEVTQKAGGYWQYFGHNVGKTLYLRPEEALFLMEVNCLLLKHNDITVSFQKAYSLILNDTASFEKYKVYASLSRLGYKVFKHKVPKINKEKNFDHNTSEDIEKLVDTKDVENILKQPLSNSNSASVEILDSDKLPITEPNNSAIGKDEDSKTTKKESIEGSEQCDNSNVIRKSPCVMEVEENEIKFSSILESIDSDKLTLNVNNVVTESNAGVNHSVSMQSNEAELHNSESENNENKTNEIKDIEGEKVMEIDDSALVESELALDGSSKVEIRVEQQQNETIDPSSSIISSIVEQKNNITEIVTPTNVKAHPEDSNVDSTDNAHNETHDKPIAMDTCYECSQAVADSTVESEDCNEGNNTTLAIDIDSTGSDIVMDLDTPKSVEFISENRKTETSSTKRDLSLSDQLANKRNEIFQNYVTKLKKLTSRQYKPSDYKTVYRHFENIPILYRKEVISINVPEQQYIPQNIFVNNSSYVLNLREIKNRSIRSASTDSTAYNSSDEVSGNHVRRLRSISNTEITQNTRFGNNLRFPPRQNLYFRPHTMWRPQNNLNYVQFNMFFQRPCYPNMYFQSRYQYPPRPNPVLRSFSIPNNSNPNNSTENVNNNIRKRIRSLRANHLQSIKNLAFRLKQFVMGGNHHIHNVESLHRLLFAFNTRYKARLRLTRDFEVINDETIVETIDLEEDDESKSKKRRLSQDNDKFNENLNLLRQLASKLKDLESKGKITSQHKRALSKAIKTFNKSYDADIYMNANFQVIDKRHINIASDSDTECVVEEPQKKRKRLRNPFNILKRRSEKEAEGKPSTSKENQDDTNNINNMVFSEDSSCNPPISKIFNENWMPNENDFGRPEVVKKSTMNTRFMDVIKEEYLLNFIKSHYEEFNNWIEVKIAFLQHMEETDIEFQTVHEKQSLTHTGIKPLIDPEDCLDSTSVLEKLRIIENNKGTSTATTLCIDFDVYNRDVPNFKKTNPPKPHFRIICMGESSSFPSSDDLIALHSKYDDNVSIVFAIVGINSVSYLQINPMDLPIYVASNDSD